MLNLTLATSNKADNTLSLLMSHWLMPVLGTWGRHWIYFFSSAGELETIIFCVESSVCAWDLKTEKYFALAAGVGKQLSLTDFPLTP